MVADLEFVGEAVAVEREVRCWISVKHFRFSSALNDRDLVRALLGDRQYADAYAGGEVGAALEHGPWLRSAIDPGNFVPVTAEAALGIVRGWPTTWGMNYDAEPTTLSAAMRDALEPLERDGVSILHLDGLDERARHDWGSVVGTKGFHEFVVIDRNRRTLDLVAASDD